MPVAGGGGHHESGDPKYVLLVGHLVRAGFYEDTESIRTAEARYWAENSYRFGSWEFRPATGEVLRGGWRVCHLTAVHALMLQELIEAYPAYIPLSEDKKKTIWGLRRAIGRDTILAVRTWGYRFNPDAVI